MAVTLKDVANRAGVSRSAVSRTFTDGASVSEKMRAKVESAALALGYSPNALASSLTTGRTKLVGLVSDNFRNPLFLEIFDQFTRGIQDRGLRSLLVNLSHESDPASWVRMMRQYSVDGVVVASSTLKPDFARQFRDVGIPVVHSFGRYSANPPVHVVGIDNAECGRMAARELVARGYTRVGFMGGPETATSTQDRIKGFREELAKHPSVQLTCSFADAYRFKAGRREMIRILADKDNPRAQAYFCGDDVLSIGARSAIEEAGLSVPGDIGLIGLNDMEMSSWQNIDLTTIHQPVSDIIDASLDLIVSMLNEPDHPPQSRLFPCTVIERGTLKSRA